MQQLHRLRASHTFTRLVLAGMGSNSSLSALQRPWVPSLRPRRCVAASAASPSPARESKQQKPLNSQDAPAKLQQHQAANASPQASPLPRVVLKGGKSKLFQQQQSPMVFSGAVDRVLGRPAPKTGAPVLVCDGAEHVIGWGVYNADSMFKVRIMQLAEEWQHQGEQQQQQQPQADLPALVRARLSQAAALRRALGLPSSDTSVYRLVNSEGDRLSGLVVDALGPDHAVVVSSAAWVEQQRDVVTQWLREALGVQEVVWKQAAEMLREEGVALGPAASELQSEDASDSGEESSSAAAEHAGHLPEASSSQGHASSSGGDTGMPEGPTVIVLEHGLRYAATPLGQKTGFYADQRDSRLLVRRLAHGRHVLDLCCFSGGFALNAAQGGAVQVTGVDSSAAAVLLAQQNAALNGLESRVSFERGEAAAYMRQAAAEGRQWDLLILDPPKLAPNRKSLARAQHKYRRLNAAAIALVSPGGLLMTCSCSGAMSQSREFLPMLQAAARDAGRRITVLRDAGAAPDHTLDPAYPEGKYLTNVLVRVL